MGRPRKQPPVIRLEVRYVQASAEDAKDAISALAQMYGHVLLRDPRALEAVPHADAMPEVSRP